MVATYEAEMNVVIHAHGGRVQARLADDAINVDVIDNGPGIPDVELAMKEGYSTASAEARALGFGAGMGLTNIKRSSDRLRVTSHVGEGTRVSFTIYFKPQASRPPHFISLQASPEACLECGRCLAACPTQAIRIRDRAPNVIESLCIDCGSCIAACRPGALAIRNDISNIDDLPHIDRLLLAVPLALLAGYGTTYPPDRVMAALRSLGFADVVSLAPQEAALRTATRAVAQSGKTSLPVITPICPAIVNLIELRFPSLIPHLAPFDSPLEAFQADHADQGVVYVVSCPSQRSALVAHEAAAGILPGGETVSEYVAPALLQHALISRLASQPKGGGSRISGPICKVGNSSARSSVASNDGSPATLSPAPLVVTGVDHVLRVLEALENGLLNDIFILEPYACQGGCFGSPFFEEDFHVATLRWEEAEDRFDTHEEYPPAVARRLPFAARQGIRLDADMAVAIEKLGRLQAILQTLPGKDCGACGAPTCTALAEDVVLERARIEDCPYLPKPKEGSGS